MTWSGPHETAKALKMQDEVEAQSSPAACNEVLINAASKAFTEIPRPIGRQTAKAAWARGSSSSMSLPIVSGGMYATQLAELTETKKVMVKLKKEHIVIIRMETSICKDVEDEHIMEIDLDSVSEPFRE